MRGDAEEPPDLGVWEVLVVAHRQDFGLPVGERAHIEVREVLSEPLTEINANVRVAGAQCYRDTFAGQTGGG
jgi:hypothetical protein